MYAWRVLGVLGPELFAITSAQSWEKLVMSGELADPYTEYSH